MYGSVIKSSKHKLVTSIDQRDIYRYHASESRSVLCENHFMSF